MTREEAKERAQREANTLQITMVVYHRPTPLHSEGFSYRSKSSALINGVGAWDIIRPEKPEDKSQREGVDDTATPPPSKGVNNGDTPPPSEDGQDEGDPLPLSSMFARTCVECGRVFDLRNEEDGEEWQYGHDCEV
jgi:hypothetical protein